MRAMPALLFFLMFAVALTLLSGKDIGWDTLNYHLYNGWAFWGGRHSIDLLPAQLQGFFNPLIDIPLGWMLRQGWSDLSIALVFGLVHAMNGFLVYLIARRLWTYGSAYQARWVAFGVAVVGFTGANMRSQIGTFIGDALVSVPILLALWLLLASPRDGAPSAARLLMAGTFAGVAVSLKLTSALWVAPLCVVAMVLAWPRESGGGPLARVLPALRAATLLGAMSVLVWLMCSGFWMLTLWREWGNPLFPFFNSLFESPLLDQRSLRDVRFLPQSLLQWLFYPLTWTLQTGLVSELRFRDLRIPLAFVAGLLLAAAMLWKRVGGKSPAKWSLPRQELALWLFAALGYLSWLLGFGIYRYLMVLELLGFLLLLLAMHRLLPMRRGVVLAMLLCGAVLVLSSKPAKWGRQAFTGSQISIAMPEIPADSAIIVATQTNPTGFIALGLPDQVPLWRLASNMHGEAHRMMALDHAIAQRVQQHPGSLFLLRSEELSDAELALLANMQVQPAENCVALVISGRPPWEPELSLCTLLRQE